MERFSTLNRHIAKQLEIMLENTVHTEASTLLIQYAAHCCKKNEYVRSTGSEPAEMEKKKVQ